MFIPVSLSFISESLQMLVNVVKPKDIFDFSNPSLRNEIIRSVRRYGKSYISVIFLMLKLETFFGMYRSLQIKTSKVYHTYVMNDFLTASSHIRQNIAGNYF